MRETIANVERNAEGGGDHGHAKSESCAGKQLAARTASKGIGNEAEEHNVAGEVPQLTRNLLSGTTQAGKIHHNVTAINVRGNVDGIAATLIADGRNVDRGAAMTADDIPAVLPIAFRATDTTSVQSCAISVGFLDDHKTQSLVRDVHGEQM